MTWTQCSVCPHPDFYVEALTPSAVAFRSKAFGRYWGYEGGEPHDEISALIRRGIRELALLSSSTM